MKGCLGLLLIIDIIDSQWSLKPWMKAKTASGDPLVYSVAHIVSFGNQYAYFELGNDLSLFRAGSTRGRYVVANSDIPSMSWHTAQGRLGECARFLLCSFRLLELVQNLERWLEKKWSARLSINTTAGPRQECQAKIHTNAIQIHQAQIYIQTLFIQIYTYPNTVIIQK